MSKNLDFIKYFHNLFGISVGILPSKIVFKMYCRFFLVYLTINRPKVGNTLKKEVKCRIPVVRVSGSWFGLSRFKDLNPKRAKKNKEIYLVNTRSKSHLFE